ncbi:hypothetical protein BGZ46_001538 [Entomortierella lignicola]|nr:hypothetical protein BGZ46_001538 [Entomortierella lignicola]
MATFYTRPASYQGNDFQGRNIRYNIQMKKSRKQYFLLALLPAVLIAIGYILIKISSKGMTVHEVEMNDKLLRPVHSTPVLITSSTSEVPATKEFLPPTKKNPIKVSKDELAMERVVENPQTVLSRGSTIGIHQSVMGEQGGNYPTVLTGTMDVYHIGFRVDGGIHHDLLKGNLDVYHTDFRVDVGIHHGLLKGNMDISQANVRVKVGV